MFQFNHLVFFIPSWQDYQFHKVKCNASRQFSSDTEGLCSLPTKLKGIFHTSHIRQTSVTGLTVLRPPALTNVQLATHGVVPTSPARFCNSLELTEFRNTVSVHLIIHDPSWEQPKEDTARARSGKVSDGSSMSSPSGVRTINLFATVWL